MGASKRVWAELEHRSIEALRRRQRDLERQLRGVKAALATLGVGAVLCESCGAALTIEGACERQCEKQAEEARRG